MSFSSLNNLLKCSFMSTLHSTDTTQKAQCPTGFDLQTLVSLPDAINFTRAHRALYPNYAKGFVFDAGTIQGILQQAPDLPEKRLKIYLGAKVSSGAQLEWNAVAVLADGTNTDWMIPASGAATAAKSLTDGVPQIGGGRPCPEECGDDNDLNHDS
jgi:hypothetical protein